MLKQIWAGRHRTAAAVVAAFAITMGSALVPVGFGLAQPAEAATANLTSLKAKVSDHQSEGGSTSGNCITYAPADTSTSSGFVSSPEEALTAHGRENFWDDCPSSLTTSKQSALGVSPQPAGTVTVGAPFPLAKVTHYNNPVNSTDKKFVGKMTIKLGGFTTTPELTYDWTMWETPNNAATCALSEAPNEVKCDDEVVFTGQIPSQTLTQNGRTYKLVVNGFSPINNGAACPATMPASAQNRWFTKEETNSQACLYGSLVEVRSLTIVKKVVDEFGATVPSTDFKFTSTSDLAGSPWAKNSFTLKAGTAATASHGPKELLQSEKVTVTETLPSSSDSVSWALTDIACVDGKGKNVPITKNLAGGSMTLSDIGAPTDLSFAPITCTFTNTRTEIGELTLVKKVDGGTAKASAWTLTAAGQNGRPTISGKTGATAVTDAVVPAGNYALSEAGGPIGYVGQGWVCTNGTVTNGAVKVDAGKKVTCTLTNKFLQGKFSITKKVSGPTGGYVGSGSTAFVGDWTCGTTSGRFSVTTNNAWTSGDFPAGTVCTVTEDAPSNNLLTDSSWSWSAPVYPGGKQVTIVDGTTPKVAIENNYAQATGSFTVAKKVEARQGAPVAGYTGGAARTFAVDYTCKIDTAIVKSGSVNVTTGTAVTVSGVPATATCALSENLAEKPGDFSDRSLRWDGNSWANGTVTITETGNPTATVTNYFTKDTAKLVIEKTVVGGGYSSTAKNFKVTYQCGTGPGATTGTVSLANGGSETVTVPARTSCTVVEAAPSGNLAASHEWGTPTYVGLTAGTVTVPANGSEKVTVTNPTVPVFGTVAVKKAITGAVDGVRADAIFKVGVSCDAAAKGSTGKYTGNFDLLANVAQSTPELPVGTTCVVTETAPGAGALVDDSYAWGATPAAQSVTVATKNTTVTATVTNTVQRAYGSLDVTKAVTALDGNNGSGNAFKGDWTCTKGGVTTASGKWSRTGAGAATLTGGADKILLGSLCTVTEDAPTGAPNATDGSYVWGAQQIGAPVTLTKANPSGKITVTNTMARTGGAFTVSKSVLGGTAGTAFVDGDFSFDWTCRPKSGSAISGTVKTKAGATGTLPTGTSIPTGSECTVTETSTPDAKNPFTWDGVSFNGGGTKATFTVEENKVFSVQAVNTLSQKSADVKIEKKVVDPDNGFKGGNFEVSLSCELNGATTAYGPKNVAGNGSTTFANVLLGSTCQAVESPIAAGQNLKDASYVWGAPTFSPAQTITSATGSYTFTVTNKVERAYGVLALDKVVVDPDLVTNPARVYSGSWVCTHPGDSDVSGTWSRTGAGAATLTGVPTSGILLNSTCTPTENALGAAPSATDSSYRWATPVLKEATTKAGSSATMKVTNSVVRDTADLKVLKQVTGQTAGYTAAGLDFTVGYTCTAPSGPAQMTGSVKVAAGAAAVLLAKDVPTSWTCAVAEQTPDAGLLVDRSYSWGTPTITGLDKDGTVKVGQGVTLTVQNPIKRNTGSFVVVKAIDSSTPNGVVKADAKFSGTWQCTYSGNVILSGTWTRTGTGAATMTPAASGLPASSTCTATEGAPSATGLVDASWKWGNERISAAVTVEAVDKPAEVTVTNVPTRVFAGLSVTKQYAGNPAALVAGAEVAGTWTCKYDGNVVGTGNWKLPAAGGTVGLVKGDGSVVGAPGAAKIPAQSVCTVTESTPSASALVDASWAWQAPTYPKAEVTLSADTVNALTVVNDVTRAYGSFAVTKKIDVPGTAAAGLTFAGGWTCRYGTDAAVKGRWTVNGQGTDTIPGILLGSVCEISSEDTPTGAPSAADPSYVWAGHTVAPGKVTVAATGTPASLEVTNHTSRVLTGLTLSKQVTGDTKAEPAGQTYDLSYVCTDASGGKHTGGAAVKGGSSYVSPKDIPLGSECVVTEGARPDVSPRALWAPVGFEVTGSGAAVVDGAKVTFTLPTVQGEQGNDVKVKVTNELLRQQAGYTLTKTADPASGTTVKPGDTIKYTLTVQPTGPGTVDDVVVRDDLTDIAPYAKVDGLQAGAGTAALDAGGKGLTWKVGTVSGTKPITLTYTATVNTAAFGVTLRNNVTATGEQPPTTCTTCPTTTDHPVSPKWTLEKSSNPATGSTVATDSEVTYTLTVTNRSAAAALPAGTVVTDDLTGVLGSGRLDRVVPEHAGAVEVGASALTWTLPQIAAGAKLTLSYVVHVSPTAWGATLTNVVTGAGQTVPPSTDCVDDGVVTRLLAGAAVVACQTTTTHHTPPYEVVSPPVVPGNPPAGGGTKPPSGLLPDTGSPLFLGPAAFLGMALIVGGVLLMRRREQQD